jgi:predicted nucleotidyltransferase
MNDSMINRVQVMAGEKYPEAEIRLFCSRARGDAKDDSDWDFLILLPEEKISFSRERKIMDDFYDIELATGQILSAFIRPKSVWESKYPITPLFHNIEKESILLQ